MSLVLYQPPSSDLYGTLIGKGNSKNTSQHEGEPNSDKKYVGLSNQGATCYLNGLLQTLFMTPEFRRAIFTWNYDTTTYGVSDLCIPLQLQKLFGLLQLSTQKSVDTVALTKSFGWSSSEVFQQQDVQELTRVLFDALEDTFKGTGLENIIDELYAGELIDYLRCIDVDYQSERVDKFLDFSLAIVPFGSDEKPLHSLSECIELFLKPELLNGDNKYYVEKLDKRVDAIKGLKFGKLPQIMAVSLKRFVYDFSGPNVIQKKLNNIVKFPLLLDMNKYVAMNKKELNEMGSEDGSTSTDRTSIVNNEFEAFLKKQMEILARDPKTSYDTENGSMAVTNGKTSSSVDDYDYDESIALPDLVDINGNKAPDQLCEEEELKVYESYDEATVEQLLQSKGEWIYELYAVLIHSGAISGGHYYAYIKDLDTKKWWNFNDSTVSMIDEKSVKEAWGGKTTTTSYSTPNYYNALYNRNTSTTETVFSSSNAYMLMYRKVSPTKTISFPTDDMVPQYIIDEVQKEEERKLNRLREEQELRNRLILKVFWKNTEHFIECKRTFTYMELLHLLWNKFNIQEEINYVKPSVDALSPNDDANEPSEQSIGMNGVDTQLDQLSLAEKESQNENINNTFDTIEHQSDTTVVHTTSLNDIDDTIKSFLETKYVDDNIDLDYLNHLRLRGYNPHTKIMTDMYDIHTCAKKKLSDLVLYDYKPYCLEVRPQGTEWKAFYSDGLSFQLVEFDSNDCLFKEARVVQFPRFCTVGMVKDTIAKWVPYGRDSIRLMKIGDLGHTDANANALDNDERRLKDDLAIYDGSKLYFEEDTGPLKDSLAFATYVSNRNHLELKVNKPPGTSPDYTIFADCRWTVKKLRQTIIEEFNLDTNDLRLFKVSNKGFELKDVDTSLAMNAVYSSMVIVVAMGKATPYGYYSLSFVQYIAPDFKPGVKTLPVVPAASKSHIVTPSSLFIDPINTNTAPFFTVETENILRNTNDQTYTVTTPHTTISYPLDQKSEDEIRPASMADINIEIANETHHSRLSTIEEDGLEEVGLSDIGDTNVVKGIPVSETYDSTEEFGSFQFTNAAELNSLVEANATIVNVIPELVVPNTECRLTPTSKVRENTLASLVGVVSTTAEVIGEKFADFESQLSIPIHKNQNDLNLVKMNDIDTNVLEAPSAPPPEVYISEKEDVTPSVFGEMTVRNSYLTNTNQPNPLENLPHPVHVQHSTTADEVRRLLHKNLLELGIISEQIKLKQIRMRDKVGNTPGRMLRDGKTLHENQFLIFDNKPIAFEILEFEEELPEDELGSSIVLVQRWHRSTWTLGEKVEVYFPGSMSVQDIARGLSILFDIPLESMLAMVVPRETEFYLSELPMKSPTRNYGRSWFEPGKETRLLKYMSHDLRVTDGDLLLIQDSAEPLRQFTMADLKSIELVQSTKITTSMDYMTNSFPSSSFMTYNNYGTNLSSTSTNLSNHKKANGIKIITHKQREEEEQKLKEENKLISSSNVDQLSKEDDDFMSNPAPSGIGETSDYEFQKQGGLILFADLMEK